MGEASASVQVRCLCDVTSRKHTWVVHWGGWHGLNPSFPPFLCNSNKLAQSVGRHAAEEHSSLRLQRHALYQLVQRLKEVKLQAGALDRFRSRREWKIKVAMFTAWRHFHVRNLEYLETMEVHRQQIGIRQALGRWCDLVSTKTHQWDLCNDATAHHHEDQLRMSLVRWFHHASLAYSAMEADQVARDYHDTVLMRECFARLHVTIPRLGKQRQLMDDADRYYNLMRTRRALHTFRANSHSLFLFHNLRTRALTRRVLLRWRQRVQQLANVRAFVMASLSREQVYLHFKYFHALSLWATKRIRLRQAHAMVVVFTHQNTLYRHMKHWAIQAAVQRRDREQQVLIDRAHRYWSRRWKRRALETMKDRCFQVQLVRLQGDDARFVLRRHVLVRAMRGWHAEAQLQRILRCRLRHVRLSRGLHSLRRFVMYRQNRRLTKAFHPWASKVLQRTSFRRHHLFHVMLGRWLVWKTERKRIRGVVGKKVAVARGVRAHRGLSTALLLWRAWHIHRRDIAMAVSFYDQYQTRSFFQIWKRHQLEARRIYHSHIKVKRRAMVVHRQKLMQAWSTWSLYSESRLSSRSAMQYMVQHSRRHSLSRAMDRWVGMRSMRRSLRYLGEIPAVELHEGSHLSHDSTSIIRPTASLVKLRHSFRRWRSSIMRLNSIHMQQVVVERQRKVKLVQQYWSRWRKHHHHQCAAVLAHRISTIRSLRHGLRTWRWALAVADAEAMHLRYIRRVQTDTLTSWAKASKASRAIRSLSRAHNSIILRSFWEEWTAATLDYRAIKRLWRHHLHRWRAWALSHRSISVQWDQQALQRHGLRRWVLVMQRQRRLQYCWMQHLSQSIEQWRRWRLQKVIATLRHRRQKASSAQEIIRFTDMMRAKRGLAQWRHAARLGAMMRRWREEDTFDE